MPKAMYILLHVFLILNSRQVRMKFVVQGWDKIIKGDLGGLEIIPTKEIEKIGEKVAEMVDEKETEILEDLYNYG